MGQPFVGEIRMGAWNFAPVNWAFCNGAIQAIDQNTALFQLIGTTYGGDGINTFALPDLQGRIPLHQGTDRSGNPYVIGQRSGTESVTVLTNQLPSHNHPLQASTGAPSSTDPTGLTFATASVDTYITPTTVVATSDPTTPTGGSQPHDNMMPFLCVSYVISLFGIFPSQG